MKGRRASLPSPDFQPQTPWKVKDAVVVHISASTGIVSEWDFRKFPGADELSMHLATCLARKAGAGGTYRSTDSVAVAYGLLKQVSGIWANMEHPPTSAASLQPSHLSVLRLRFGGRSRTLRSLRSILSANPAPYSEAFRAALSSFRIPKNEGGKQESYPDSEFQKIWRTSLIDVRSARQRIRKNLVHLERWRAGTIDRSSDATAWERGRILDFIARHGDVLRNRDGRISYENMAKGGFITEAGSALYLSKVEAASFAVLLSILTGQNFGTLATAPASHHDTGLGEQPGTTIVNLVKPRRGKLRAHMAVPLQDTIPSWVPPAEADFSPGNKELLSARGIYLLLLELTRPARELGQSPSLFLWTGKTNSRGRMSIRSGLSHDTSVAWNDEHALTAENGQQLRLNWHRLRLTHLKQHGRPVAHTVQTLHRDYLIRDGGDLIRYQEIVSQTLEERVKAARQAMQLTLLTVEDLQAAQRDPDAAAKTLGIAAETLLDLLDKRLDTVLAACKNHDNGPYSPGRACQASFLLCAGCPCAVAMPHHLVMQVAAHDALLSRQKDTSPLVWVERFGAAWARLDELLRQYASEVVMSARMAVTEEHESVVTRLLNREMDV